MTEGSKAVQRLKEKFGDASMSVEESNGALSVFIGVERLRDALCFLKEDPECAFEMLTDLFGVDARAQGGKFVLVYLLNSLKNKERLRVKVRLDDGKEMPTVSDMYRAADWLEREAFDMLGIRFSNHPDMRRILLEETFEGHPLRKDFPTEGYDFDKPFVVTLEEDRK